MADNLAPEVRQAVMRAVRSKNTSTELRVRRIAHGLGYRYRLHGDSLPGSPDLVFAGRRAVLFVHGCFWHQHEGCPRSARPSSRTEYWERKLAGNVHRDRDVQRLLRVAGWNVLVLWECQIADTAALEAVLRDQLGPPRAARSERTGAAKEVAYSTSTSPDSPSSGVGVAASPPRSS